MEISASIGITDAAGTPSPGEPARAGVYRSASTRRHPASTRQALPSGRLATGRAQPPPDCRQAAPACYAATIFNHNGARPAQLGCLADAAIVHWPQYRAVDTHDGT